MTVYSCDSITYGGKTCVTPSSAVGLNRPMLQLLFGLFVLSAAWLYLKLWICLRYSSEEFELCSDMILCFQSSPSVRHKQNKLLPLN